MIEELVRQVTRLQERVDDLIKPEVGRWVDWTPTVTQSVAVAATVTEAKYKLKDKGIRIYCQLAITGAGTAGNAIIVAGWPATINPSPTPTYWPLGSGVVVGSGTAYMGTPYMSGGAIRILYHSTNTSIGANPNFGLLNGDFIYFNMFWKIA